MISLSRRDGRPLRIGHRGAATLAPENTLASFRAAVDAGVDLVEFDVVAAAEGELVVAHARADIGPATPTFYEACRYLADEAPEVGAHVDLKLRGREGDVVAVLRRHGLEGRSFVSSVYLRTARAIGAAGADVATGITFPRSLLGVSERGPRAPVARAGLRAFRVITPTLVRPLLGLTDAHAITLHHSLVTPASVRAAHARGAAVVTWTIDDPEELVRVDAAGVDAVVTNDPRIFTSTLPA